jgi:hypothetical protein
MALVDIKDVQKAINDNDYDLAKKNWDKIKGWLVENMESGIYSLTITKENLPLIDYFFDKGLDYWFDKTDKKILNNWCNQPEGHQMGFEEFLKHIVNKSKQTNEPIKWHKDYEDYDEEDNEDDYENDEDYDNNEDEDD